MGVKFSWQARGRSFRYAYNGLARFFLEEHNALLHLLATAGVGILILYFRVRGGELIALLLVTSLVWVTELLNTALEKTMDLLHPGRHPQVKYIKDLAAAAVLISAVTALVTGALIFIPKIFL